MFKFSFANIGFNKIYAFKEWLSFHWSLFMCFKLPIDENLAGTLNSFDGKTQQLLSIFYTRYAGDATTQKKRRHPN